MFDGSFAKCPVLETKQWIFNCQLRIKPSISFFYKTFFETLCNFVISWSIMSMAILIKSWVVHLRFAGSLSVLGPHIVRPAEKLCQCTRKICCPAPSLCWVHACIALICLSVDPLHYTRYLVNIHRLISVDKLNITKTEVPFRKQKQEITHTHKITLESFLALLPKWLTGICRWLFFWWVNTDFRCYCIQISVIVE